MEREQLVMEKRDNLVALLRRHSDRSFLQELKLAALQAADYNTIQSRWNSQFRGLSMEDIVIALGGSLSMLRKLDQDTITKLQLYIAFFNELL